MSETGYIYGLLDPRDSKIRYVGRTTFPLLRYKQHISEALGSGTGDSAKIRWIRDLDKQGHKPTFVILEVLEDLTFAPESYGRHPKLKEGEFRWTERLVSEGHPLLNYERHLNEQQKSDAQIVDDAIRLGRTLFG